MKNLLPIVPLVAVIAFGSAAAAETGQIKRKPPDAAEGERLASETVMNDSLLQKGDVVVTDRGFFVFHGVASDGSLTSSLRCQTRSVFPGQADNALLQPHRKNFHYTFIY